MTKHLRIEVNGNEYVNGEFAEITFTDGPNGVRIEGKTARQSAGGGGGGLLDLLAGATRNRTEPVAQEKKSSIADQPVVVGEPVVAEVIEQA